MTRQVVKLGLLRLTGSKIPALLQLVCGPGHARYGSVTDTLKMLNERILCDGRLCLASRAPPGYVRQAVPIAQRVHSHTATPFLDRRGETWYQGNILRRGEAWYLGNKCTDVLTAMRLAGTDMMRTMCGACAALFVPESRYLVPKGTKQSRLRGRQWRHTVMYLIFMLPGLIPSVDHDKEGPSLAAWVAHESSKVNKSRKRRRGPSPQESSATSPYDSLSEVSEDAKRANQPAPPDSPDSPTDKKVFRDMPPREAVVDVSCRAAVLMGKLCGDNQEHGAERTEKEARELAREADLLVTRYMGALVGPTHTTKMHRLEYHFLDELLLRGNLVDADTSINEMLHKLCKVMFP